MVITSYDGKKIKDLFELLDSVKKQSYSRVEVIYIIVRSKNLLLSLKNYADRIEISNVKFLFRSRDRGLAHARNLGVKKSRGEIIAFVDDDVILPSNWSEEMVKTYRLDDMTLGVTGRAEPAWEDKSMQWLPEEFYWLISCTAWAKLDRTVDTRSAWGMNMSFRREAFSVSGLFDTERSGYHKQIAEDLDFSLRLRSITGGSIKFNPSVKVWHRVYRYRLSWSFVMKRSLHIGFSRYVIRRKYGNLYNVFNRERELGEDILKLFFPKTMKILFKNPSIGVRRIQLLVMSLIFIIIGYLHGMLVFNINISRN